MWASLEISSWTSRQSPVKRAFVVAQVLTALIAISCPAMGHAEIYCWTDENGTVSYSNLPPPKGVKVTDVIAEAPEAAQSQADTARRVEVSALNDRIRLLELEMARAKREAVDYAPPAPPAPAAMPAAGFGCSTDGYGDCDYPWSPYPYYFTGGYGYRGRGPAYPHGYGHGGGHPGKHPGPTSIRLGRAGSAPGGHASLR